MERYRDRHWSAMDSTRWQEGDGQNAKHGALYAYRSGSIAAIRVIWGMAGAAASVSVAWRDGHEAQWSVSKPEIDVYADQFDLSVSPDGQRIFVQTDRSGLYCLDAATGKTLWRSGSKRGVTSLAVNATTLVAHQCGRALLLLDAATGEVLREKAPARAWCFYQLSPTHLICHTTARQWEIIRTEDLETVQVIPHRLFPRTNGDDGWCIRDVWLEDGRLWYNAFRDDGQTDALIPVDVSL